MKRMRLRFSLAVAAALFAAPAASAKTVAWYHFNEGANGEAMRGGEGVYAITNATDSAILLGRAYQIAGAFELGVYTGTAPDHMPRWTNGMPESASWYDPVTYTRGKDNRCMWVRSYNNAGTRTASIVLVNDDAQLYCAHITAECMVKMPEGKSLAHNWTSILVMRNGGTASDLAWGIRAQKDGRMMVHIVNTENSFNGATILGSGRGDTHYFYTPTPSGGIPNITDGEWHHLAITYDGGTIRAYIDYSEVTSLSWSGGIVYGSGDNSKLCIGGFDAASYGNWPGCIDEVRISDEALPPEKFLRMYNYASDSANINSKSYIQDGLVAHYDGIDNAGVGRHSYTTNRWVDLTGNGYDGVVTNGYDGVAAPNFAWYEDGWEATPPDNNDSTVTRQCRPITIGTAVSSVTGKSFSEYTSSKNFTIQFACRPSSKTSNSKRVCIVSQYANAESFAIESGLYYGTTEFPSAGRFRLYTAKPDQYRFADSILANGEWGAVSVALGRNASDDFTCTIWSNATQSARYFTYPKNNEINFTNNILSASTTLASTNTTVIGGEVSETRDMVFRGRFNTLRLYNRVLTDEEVAINAAIDAIRFNGKSWEGDFPELAAKYSFAPDGTLLPKINSRSYVQDGLVAHYDAIDNAGVGHHDGSAATWVNLTGDYALDGDVTNVVTWSDSYWSVNENCKPVTIDEKLSQTFATREFTAQFACMPNETVRREAFVSTFWKDTANPVTNTFSIEHNLGFVPNGCIRFYSDYGSSSTAFTDGNGLVAGGEWASLAVSLANGGQEIAFWKNGENVANDMFSPFVIANSAKTVLGGEPNTNLIKEVETRDMSFRGKYNAFRLYNRVLSADENRLNAAIDAVRFNGADWETGFPDLAAKYAFDESGELTFKFYASAGDNGKVQMPGTTIPAAPTASAGPFAAGVVQSVTFSAVADSGYVFYRWEGDIDAISSGTYRDTAITVTADHGVSLTAVFIAGASGTVSSKLGNWNSYVQDGLVAHYDGEKNAGSGAAHSSSATTWVNLGSGGSDFDATMAASGVTWNSDGKSWSTTDNCKPFTIGNAFSAVTVNKNFTIQFAATPSRMDHREAFVSQFDNDSVLHSFSIEHCRYDQADYGKILLNVQYPSQNNNLSDNILDANEWGSVSVSLDSSAYAIWNKNVKYAGNLLSNTTFTNDCTTVIGGEPWNNSRDMAFRGKFYALRLYNRVLADREVEYNSVVDAIRFNNSAGFPSGYRLDGEKMMIAMTATAGEGGTVALAGGEYGASATSAEFEQDLTADNPLTFEGRHLVAFSAKANEGYVFDRWVGDIDMIVTGLYLTPEIEVRANFPAKVTAVFKKPSAALDDLELDLAIWSAGDGICTDYRFEGSDEATQQRLVGNSLYAGQAYGTYNVNYYGSSAGADGIGSTTWTDGNPRFATTNVVPPAAPHPTNMNQKCLWFMQMQREFSAGGVSGTGQNNCAIHSLHDGIMGDTSTFHVRFLWGGATIPETNNNCVVFMNGYAWDTDAGEYVGRGFGLKIMTASGQPGQGYLNVFVPGKTTPALESCSTYFAIASNRWVDAFVSVYPSPGDQNLSNADIWYCQEPLTRSGAYRDVVFRHRHFGDDYALPRMNAEERFVGAVRSQELRFGCEKLTGYSNTVNDRENCLSAFRGCIAGVKGWKRLLSENEMWSVMLGKHGGVFDIGVVNGSSAEFCTNTAVVQAVYNTGTNKWYELRRYLTADERSITIDVPLPKWADSEPTSKILPEILELHPLFEDVGSTCFVTVYVNGTRIRSRNLMSESCRRISLRGAMTSSDSKMRIMIERPEGCAGRLSFDALRLRGAWKFGSVHNAPGWTSATSSEFCPNDKGVAPVVVVGDPDNSHVHQLLTWFYPTLSILFSASSDGRGYVYETETCNLGLNNGETTFPVHLELNGEKIWPTDADVFEVTSATANTAVSVAIPQASLVKGLNELKWVYHYDEALKSQDLDSSYMGFDCHLLKFVSPPQGFMTIIRN